MNYGFVVMMLAAMLVTGCGAALPPAPATPAPPVAGVTSTAPPPVTPTATPTAVPAVTAVATVVVAAEDTPAPVEATNTPPPPPDTPTPEPDWLNTVGRTENNLVFLGNPDAPVTVVDYSDFM